MTGKMRDAGPIVSKSSSSAGFQGSRSPRLGASLVAQMVKKESACNAGEPGSIPGSGRSPGEWNGDSFIHVWRIPWTEEPVRIQSTGLQRGRHN